MSEKKCIKKEDLLERIATMEEQRKQALANANACDGAAQMLQSLVKEFFQEGDSQDVGKPEVESRGEGQPVEDSNGTPLES